MEEHSLSGSCGSAARLGKGDPLRSTCAAPGSLGPVTRANGFDLCPAPHALRRSFFGATRSSFAHVDAFVCFHPPALCELFMPFNKSVLVLASVNLELARENPPRWRAWLRNLRAIAADRRNVVAANNRYDVEYIRHFTGGAVAPAYLPAFCGYTGAAYDPAKVAGNTVLFTRNLHHPTALAAQLTAAASRRGFAKFAFARTEEAFPAGFEYAQLAAAPAYIVIPYTKSVMHLYVRSLARSLCTFSSSTYSLNSLTPLLVSTHYSTCLWQQTHQV